MGRSRYKIYDTSYPYFVTCTILHWIPIFTRVETVEIIINSLKYLQLDANESKRSHADRGNEGVSSHIDTSHSEQTFTDIDSAGSNTEPFSTHKEPTRSHAPRGSEKTGLIIYAFVILENHLHLIIQSNTINKDLARFKSFTARAIIDYLKKNNAKSILDQLKFYKKAHKADRVFQLWQEGSQPKQIQSAKMMKERINYIHNNPVKRGYVDEPEHWRYSSARVYLGKLGLLEVEIADGF